MIVLAEGRVCPRVAEEVFYPEINSCLTITCVDENNRFVGGHAIVVPEPQLAQLSIGQIVTHILVSIPLEQRGHVFLIGDIVTWDASLPHIAAGHASVAAIAAGFGCQWTIIDIEPFTNAGAGFVDVYFSPIGRCEVRVHGAPGYHQVVAWD